MKTLALAKVLYKNKSIRERFGIHRGLTDNVYKQNSLEAIKAAIDLNPSFVEFDVMLFDDEVKTGHPPQQPLEEFERVLYLFKNKKTYPKIDIKLTKNKHCFAFIDKVIGVINQTRINFVLINVGGYGTRMQFMRAEKYFDKKVRDSHRIRLNIDLARYRNPEEDVDKGIRKHVERLKNIIYSISPEIHEENMKIIAEFAKKHRIKIICFWLRGWPDVPKPRVAEEIIRNALVLEKNYPIKVYFDINPWHVNGLSL